MAEKILQARLMSEQVLEEREEGIRRQKKKDRRRTQVLENRKLLKLILAVLFLPQYIKSLQFLLFYHHRVITKPKLTLN
jgi:hypothetical protein